MIELGKLVLKNYLSTGAISQEIDMSRQDLTLILGENLDLGGDGSKNGAGKSTLIQALSYVLFGYPLSDIRKDLLINRTNGKNMLVTLDFKIGGKPYRIERGRKPNVLRFIVDGIDKSDKDDAQGDSRETQAAIEETLNMSHDMFKQIIALNTYNEPFLRMKAQEQRVIIEQLLGITVLSEKAETLKAQIKDTKDAIQREEFRIRGVIDANQRINEQIENLKRRQTIWNRKHAEDLNVLVSRHDMMADLDIEDELRKHAECETIRLYAEKHNEWKRISLMFSSEERTHANAVSAANTELESLSKIDIVAELAAHDKLANWLKESERQREIGLSLAQLRKDIAKEEKTNTKLSGEVASLLDHKCHACGQDLHDDTHTINLANKQKALLESSELLEKMRDEVGKLTGEKKDVGAKPSTTYPSIVEAHRHQMRVDNATQTVERLASWVNQYAEQLSGLTEYSDAPSIPPQCFYTSYQDAIAHREKLSALEQQIVLKTTEADPYAEQLEDMTSNAVMVVDYGVINELKRFLDHQQFLLNLLTNKDSFVRKRIIDQNLMHLNSRLTYYLDKIGLPHQVVFLNDLSVEITELGRQLDYGNLSRGESNRLILALSFAFRDIWESIYQPINVLCVDELIDSGLDTIGVESSLAILKDMARNRNKSVWLISHREELCGRVQNVLKAIKENGFTSYAAA